MKILLVALLFAVTGCATAAPAGDLSTPNELKWQAPPGCEAGVLPFGVHPDGSVIFLPVIKCSETADSTPSSVDPAPLSLAHAHAAPLQVKGASIR